MMASIETKYNFIFAIQPLVPRYDPHDYGHNKIEHSYLSTGTKELYNKHWYSFSNFSIILQLLVGKWLNTNTYVSVISRLVVQPSFDLLALTIHLLSVCH